MLTGRVLNSAATLNDWDVIGTLEFIPGSSFDLVIQLQQAQRADKLRYVADSGATLVAHLPKTDGTLLDVTMTAFVDDRSIWKGSVTAVQSEDLVGGNFTFTLTEGVEVTLGIVPVGLSVIITGACC